MRLMTVLENVYTNEFESVWVADKIPEGIEEPDCPSWVLRYKLFIVSEPLEVSACLRGRKDCETTVAFWRDTKWSVINISFYTWPSNSYRVYLKKICDLSSEEIAGVRAGL